MLTEELADPEATTPADLRARYADELAAVVDEHGTASVADATDLDADRIDAVAAGDAAVTLADAAAVLSLSPEYPSAEEYLLELRDHLMLQMSSAVVDIDALRRGIGTDLDAKELQQKVEGRREMTLEEYARVIHYLAVENPW